MTIETDVKATRKHRCRQCRRILQDGHLSEDENKKALEKIEAESPGINKPPIKKTSKNKIKAKTTRKKTATQNSAHGVKKKKSV